MQISDHIHAVRVPFRITTPSGMVLERFVYCYLIYGETITMIDTGVMHSEHILFEYISQSGRAVDDIARIIHTHAHPDHIGATSEIVARTGARVALHQAERHWLEDVEVQYAQRPVPGFHALVGGSAAVNEPLADGQQLVLDDQLSLRVLHTPGHSPGSVSLLLEQENMLFSGDVVPIPGEMPIYDDARASLTSLHTLQELQVDMLLAAWDTPRDGKEIPEVLDDAIAYVQRVHHAVRGAVAGSRQIDRQIVMRTLEQLGFPPATANPLIARTVASHLALIDCNELIDY